MDFPKNYFPSSLFHLPPLLRTCTLEYGIKQEHTYTQTTGEKVLGTVLIPMSLEPDKTGF